MQMRRKFVNRSVSSSKTLRAAALLVTMTAVFIAWHGKTSAFWIKFLNEVHQEITQEALDSVQLPSSAPPLKFAPFHRQLVVLENVRTDQDQGTVRLHCDNESIGACTLRLVALRSRLVGSLSSPDVISIAEVFRLLDVLGQAFHTLQDFYAHTTYPYVTSLGRSTYSADTSYPVCSPDTGTPVPDTVRTSGHAGSKLQLATGAAPDGRCAHGLIGNGINKDFRGRAGFASARTAAVRSSREFVESVFADLDFSNPVVVQSVCKFMTGKTCPVDLTVSPSEATVFQGMEGGPFEMLEGGSYTIQNPNMEQTITYRVDVASDWISISGGSGGVIEAGDTVTFQIGLDDSADALGFGTNSGAVIVSQVIEGAESAVETISVSLDITLAFLEISPLEDFIASGPLGGPFRPSSKVYTIFNPNPVTTISYRVGTDQPEYVTFDDPAMGMIGPEEEISITVNIVNAEDIEKPGFYEAGIGLENFTIPEQGLVIGSVELTVFPGDSPRGRRKVAAASESGTADRPSTRR